MPIIVFAFVCTPVGFIIWLLAFGNCYLTNCLLTDTLLTVFYTWLYRTRPGDPDLSMFTSWYKIRVRLWTPGMF